MGEAKALKDLNGSLLPSLYDLVSTAEFPVRFNHHAKHNLQATDIQAGHITLEWEDGRGKNSKHIEFKPHLTHPEDALFKIVKMSHPGGVDMYPRKLTYYRHWDCMGEATIDILGLLLLTCVIYGFKFESIYSSDSVRSFDEWLPSVILGLQAAHTVEVVLRMFPRLRLFRVPLGPCLLWVMATLTGGVVAIRRFDRSVEPLEVEQDMIDDLYNLYG